MRIAELDLLKYGRFDGKHLIFPSGPSDLHIVFGDNEAGKSTTLAAINDLLFGFPHTTPYDFRFDKQLLRVGAVLEADGVPLAVRRKKGRVGTLLDLSDKPLDDGALAPLLAGYSAEAFQRMFSLDHARLRQGGQAILDAKDDIGQAIFAAGAGLVGIAEVLDDLETASGEIWSRRARADRHYHAAQNAFDEARARLKAAQIRPAAWDDLRAELARLDAALDTMRARRAALQHERETVERRRRVLPHAALYWRALAGLAALAGSADLPADAAEIVAAVDTTLIQAETEATLASDERERLRAEIDAVVVDPELIARRDDIEALRETKGAVAKGLEDQARRRLELATRGRRLNELQGELGWPREAAAAARGRAPQRVLLADLRALLETRSGLDATLAAGEADEAAARQTWEGLQVRLNALPADRDLGELSAALQAARGLGDIETLVRQAARERERRGAALRAHLAQLDPWTGTIETLGGLALPTESQTAAALADATQCQADLAQARREHRAELERGGGLDLQRAQLLQRGDAVSLEMIQAARDARDALWGRVRAHLADAESLPDPRATSEDFESRLGEADQIADRRHGAAEQSARLTAVQEDLARHALDLTRQAMRVADAETRCTAAVEAWRRLAPAGAPGLDPAAFGVWSDRRRRALEVAEEVDRAADVLADLQRRREEAADRLAGVLVALDQAVADRALAPLAAAAERLETAEFHALQLRRDLGAQVAAGDDVLKRAQAKQLTARRGLTSWESRWTPAVAGAGLDAERPHAVVRAQIDLIGELRVEVEEIIALEQRIDAIEADRVAFETRVTAMAGLFEVQADTPDQALAMLAAAAQDAAAARTNRAQLAKQLSDAERRIARSVAAQAYAMARLAPLSRMAGSEDRAALAAAVQASDQARILRGELERLSVEILGAGAGPGLDALLAEVAEADGAALLVRGGDLADALSALSDDVARLTGERATTQAAFSRLDDGPDAAIAAADAEQARSEMAAQAEAYVRKRAEVALLRWTIARYRAQKQSPLLNRASALFSTLTLGRYVALLVDLEADKARLTGLRADGAVTPIEGMSEGTLDQLFLALRLAAVEDAVRGGAVLPFLADDLFINYDNARAEAGLRVLADLARTTQVLFFTHHAHLATIAERALAPLQVSRRLLA